jgi:hypothetical protein
MAIDPERSWIARNLDARRREWNQRRSSCIRSAGSLETSELGPCVKKSKLQTVRSKRSHENFVLRCKSGPPASEISKAREIQWFLDQSSRETAEGPIQKLGDETPENQGCDCDNWLFY